MQFYYTVSPKELRPASMTPVPILLSAASFARPRKDGSVYLRPPKLPDTIVTRGADCGGFTAAMHWNGTYRFTPLQYMRWLSSWRPQWAATFDMPCLDPQRLDRSSPSLVEERQRYSTEMAEVFWYEHRLAPWKWCPTITGWSPSQYENHARQLAPLIRAMFLYYSDPGWADEDEDIDAFSAAFRVGIGTLLGRAKPAFVLDIIQRVSAIIGEDIPLHCWGVKLATFKAGVQLLGVISLDSGAWHRLFGPEYERRRASGLSIVEYNWQVSQPAYERRITTAQAKPQQYPLNFSEPENQLSKANAIRHRIVDSLTEEDGMAEQWLQQLMREKP